MDILSALGAVLLFSLACNLDTVLAAVGQGAHGHRPGLRDALLIAVMTTVVTGLALILGALGVSLFPGLPAGRLGGMALTGLGLWYLAEPLFGKDGTPSAARSSALLAVSLAVNNAGAGLAAGMAGLPPLPAALCNFFVTLAALTWGRRLGSRLTRWSRLALPLSGLMLAALGLWQLLRLT